MPDKTKNIEKDHKEIEEKRTQGLIPPEIKRGDEVQVEGIQALVYAMLYDPNAESDISEFEIGIVYLEQKRGMASRAKWSKSEKCWEFVKNEIPNDARPALEPLVQKLRFKVVK